MDKIKYIYNLLPHKLRIVAVSDVVLFFFFLLYGIGLIPDAEGILLKTFLGIVAVLWLLSIKKIAEYVAYKQKENAEKEDNSN